MATLLPHVRRGGTHRPIHQLGFVGAWEGFLLHEILPRIEQRYGRRGVFGKSSGGYGAITHALRHSDVWSAAAGHSGDMGFELCYLPICERATLPSRVTQQIVDRRPCRQASSPVPPSGRGGRLR
jgi:hypothetical protein